MKFEELLSRADSALSTLMPHGAMSIVTAIDPKLAYPKNLIQVLLRLRPASALLDYPETRKQLLLMLTLKEATELATRISHQRNSGIFEFLENYNFKKASDRAILFEFFEMDIPVEEVRESQASITEAAPQFGLFLHQARALRQVEEYLRIEPHRTLLHMPTGSGKTRTAMNLVANYYFFHPCLINFLLE
jgi:primosomal protein N'